MAERLEEEKSLLPDVPKHLQQHPLIQWYGKDPYVPERRKEPQSAHYKELVALAVDEAFKKVMNDKEIGSLYNEAKNTNPEGI